MDPDAAARQREAQMEAVRHEMERKSLDTLRIFNPLDEDFKYVFNSYTNVLKAHSSKDVPRYLAAHYFKKMSEYMIGLKQAQVGDSLLKERKARKAPDFLDKYVENREIWDKVPKLNDENELKDLRDILILGLVEEYGAELPEVIEGANKPTSFNPIANDLVNEVTKRVAADSIDDITND